jgi:OmcA/MtrC family decaheme c-type cytochrome
MQGKNWIRVLLMGLMVTTLVMAGCSGDDGDNGAPGAPGAPGADGQTAYEIAVDNGYTGTYEEYAALVTPDAAAAVEPESCGTCHAGVGDMHQAVYDDGYNYTITLKIDDVTSVANVADPLLFDTTVTFSLEQNGLPYIDADGLPSFGPPSSKGRFYGYLFQQDPAYNSEYDVLGSFSQSAVKAIGDGIYTVTKTGLASDVEAIDGGIWLEVAQSAIEGTEGPLYSEIATDGVAYNGMATTVSAANVAGCEKCHGAPYGKHGYRVAAAGNLPEFAPCAGCHYAGRSGGHDEWQMSQDDPSHWADPANTTAKTGIDYAYEATVMGDVHMSHAMEFPYPQSMSNCIVCHDGKLDMILTDEYMTLKTCKTCHWDEGDVKEGVYDTTALALATIVPHNIPADGNCTTNCHTANGIAPTFSEIHPGYDTTIYAGYDNATSKATNYADVVKVSIKSASFDAATNVLTAVATVHSSDTAIVKPADVDLYYAMWGLFAYDSDDLLTSRNNATTAADGAYLKVVDANTIEWTATADFSAYAAEIADGTVNRAKFSFLSELIEGGVQRPVYSANETIVLADGTFGAQVKFVDMNKCNVCHESLGLTFHSFTYGGGPEGCKTCHVATSGGSHLEMQSRSIDSYVHAIHSFQAFDRESVDFDEPFEAKHYEIHTQDFFYPLFTTMACESCHNPGTYNVPDQSVSLAAMLSGAEANDTTTRNISDDTPSVIVGPAANACGGCHRAMFIKRDDAGGLTSFNQHAKQFGYRVEDTSTQATVWETIQSYFQ